MVGWNIPNLLFRLPPSVKSMIEGPEVKDSGNILRVVDVVAGYGGEAVIKSISIEVRRGEVVLIMGPNGSGKSTLAKAITGELGLLGGQVFLRNVDISKWGEERRSGAGVGYVPQSRDVFPRLSVRDNLEMGAYRLNKKAGNDAIDRVLETFPQLGPLLRRPARQLSGGERKLVGIARALVADPDLIILDEPTANLSPRVAESVLTSVVDRLSELGHGVLLIEQRIAAALERADTVHVLVDGRPRHSGPAAALRGSSEIGDLFFR